MAHQSETGPASPSGRTGRRKGNAETRAAILAAARICFGESGYVGTTMRSVAKSAEVDPALIHYYFGNKEDLFIATMNLAVNPGRLIPELLAEGPDGLGERLLRFFLNLWEGEQTGSALIALIRSAASHEDAARMLREFVSTEILGRVAAALATSEPATRATLVGSQLIGLAMLRYVIKVEPLASLGHDELVAKIGPTIQRYLTEPLPS